MSRRLVRPPRASSLIGRRYLLPDIGRVELRTPGSALLENVDREWPTRRESADNAIAWRWSGIMKDAEDRFALLSAAGDALALWCSKRRRIALPDGAFYRLDYLEVDAEHRASNVGQFAVALAAARAIEIGADGLVLGAIPNVSGFYERVGFRKRSAAGWSVESGLIAFELKGGDLERIAGFAEAFRDES